MTAPQDMTAPPSSPRILMTRAADACARWMNILHPMASRLTYVDPFITTPVAIDRTARDRLLAVCGDDATAWAITSPRAISALAASDAELLAQLRQRSVYAVGEGTASALRAAGFNHVHAADGDMASLASLIALTAPSKNITRIIHLAASVTVADIKHVLAATPLQTETQVVYRAEPAPLPDDVRRDLVSGDIGSVVLLSARVAEHIAACIKGDMAKAPRLFCLSSRIADAARAAFAPHVCDIVIAPRPDIAALLTMIDAPASGLHNMNVTLTAEQPTKP